MTENSHNTAAKNVDLTQKLQIKWTLNDKLIQLNKNLQAPWQATGLSSSLRRTPPIRSQSSHLNVRTVWELSVKPPPPPLHPPHLWITWPSCSPTLTAQPWQIGHRSRWRSGLSSGTIWRLWPRVLQVSVSCSTGPTYVTNTEMLGGGAWFVFRARSCYFNNTGTTTKTAQSVLEVCLHLRSSDTYLLNLNGGMRPFETRCLHFF